MLNKIENLNFFSFVKSREISVLILLGLLFRVILFFLYLHTTQFPDSYSFRILAEKMLEFSLNNYSGERSPGYPLILFLAFGQVKLVVIYQFLMGIIASVYSYKTLINLKFSKKASLLIALFLESFLHVFCYETSILSETISLLFISMIFYEITKNGYFENKSIKKELYFSFLLGFLVIVKPFFAFIPFLIYGFSILKNFSFRRIISSKLLLLLFPLISYFGWSYVNKINTGYFVSTTFFGLNIAQNCVYFAENSPPEYDWISKPYVKHRETAIAEKKDVAMAIWYAYEAGELGNKMSFPDLSNELGKYGKETIKNNQKAYWDQVITKSWLDFWNVYDMKQYVEFRIPLVDKIISGIWILQKIILIIFKFFFVLLIPFYAFTFFRNRKITYELVIVTTVFFTSFLQAMVVFGTNSKYSFPFEYLMIIVVLLFVKNYFISSKRPNTSLQ